MKRAGKWVLVVLVACCVALAVAGYTPDAELNDLLARYAYQDSRFLTHEGMSVHYRDVGQGEPLVLLHGTSSSIHTWEKWIEALSPYYRVIAVDLPGFGLTGPFIEHDDYSMDAYVRWLHGFLQKLGVQNAHMAGNSFGGHLAWRYAVDHPDNVDRLILISPSGFPLGRSTVIGFRLGVSPVFSWLVKYYTPFRIVRRSVVGVYGQKDKVSDELVTRYRDLTLRPGNRRSLVRRLRSVNWEQTELLRQVKVPVLLMWGTEDELIPYEEHSHHFMAILPRAELISYRGVGHIAMEEIPMRTSQDAMLFLRKIHP